NLLVQNFSGRRLVRLAESGCRVRLLFLNPASSAVKRRERELGLKRGELGRAVEMNILHMRRVRSRLRDPGAFEIQVYDETPRCTAYLVDGDGSDGIAVVQNHLRRTRGMEAPVLVLRNGTKVVKPGEVEEGGLFPTYREEFELRWAESRRVSGTPGSGARGGRGERRAIRGVSVARARVEPTGGTHHIGRGAAHGLAPGAADRL